MSTTSDQPGTITGYDAALDSSARSLLLFPTNSRVEFQPVSRRRLQAKNRALEANFAFATRIRSKFGRCVAGKGIIPVPITTDLEWNKRAKEYFLNWASNPWTYSIDASRDLWEDQRLAAEELGAGDGEFFEALVKKDGMPMVQPLDPFEIESPWGGFLGGRPSALNDPRLFEDGVRTNEFLRPLSYAVRELPEPTFGFAGYTWREVPAAQMVHVFRRRRPKQLRGLPPMYSGLNDGNDSLDLLALMKGKQKLHSVLAVAKIVKAQNKGRGITENLKKVLNSDGTVSHFEDQLPRGAATIELEEGEDLRLLTSNTPGTNELDAVRFYCSLMGLGADLPFSVVYSFAGIGGTASRADLEDAQSTFEMRQDQVVWRQSQRVYVYALADAMDTGKLPRCKDPYWWASDWHGPAKITVDYGRSAAANIDLTRNGLMSHERYFEERGMNAYDEMRKQIAFMKWLRAECESAGIPIETIIEPTPGAVTNVNVSQPDNSAA